MGEATQIRGEMMRQSVEIAAICAALLTMIVPAVQASPLQKKTDPDTVELSNYKLSAATLKKVTSAAHAFAQAMQNDPKFKGAIAAGRELEALENKDPRTPAEDRRIEELQKQVDEAEKQMQALTGSDDKDDSATLTDMARKLSAIPHMDEAFKSAGLTAHEFALFEASLLQAAMVAGFKKAGTLQQIPPGVPPENVQFVLDHEAEIQQVQKEMSGFVGNGSGSAK
jgi:hypothetical protein